MSSSAFGEMAKVCNYLALLTFLVAVSGVTVSSSTTRCLPNQFLDRKTGDCLPCSSCPVNRITRHLCTEYRDTVCTPFYEFEFFNQGPDIGGLELTTQRAEQLQAQDAPNYDNGVVASQTKGPTLQNDDAKWKVLCFGLIGALSIVVLLSLVFLLLLHLHQRGCRRAPKETNATDVEGTFFVHQDFMTPQPLRGGATRKPRFLHLENQLAKNKHHKRILRRIFRPGVKFFWGNDYVDNLVDVGARGPFLLDTIPEAEAPSTSPETSGQQSRTVSNMNVAEV